MSTPPAGRGGRWNNQQQGAFNNPSRGRGNRQNGRGANNMRMQNPQGRGRGTNPRGAFNNAGRGRGAPNQQMQQFQVGGIVRQPQFPGSIPSAPTQQVVMVPNHLLQQAVTPFPFFQQQQGMVATQPGVMQQYQQFVPNPQQQAFLIQQQQQQQRQLQLRANQQNANQANQANRAVPGKPFVPGKPTQNAPQPSPPQQAKPPTQMNANPPQMQTQNKIQAPNQPSPSPIHPMNAQTQQQQFAYVIPGGAYPHQQYMVRQQPAQMVNPAMMNPLYVQQQMLLQQQAQQQRARQAAALQQQQQQQQQQQNQGKKDDQQKQTQPRNFMQMPTAMYANQQVRMGGPMPPMMAQPGMQQQWANMAAFQQQQQQQQQANRPGVQPQPQPPKQQQQPTANVQPSRPPTGITQKNQQEMMKKFAAVATPDIKKPSSPGEDSLPNKGGTPLSAKAACFVPGAFGGSSSPSPPPSQPPPRLNKGDPTQPKVIPPTVVPSPGVPAEMPSSAGWSNKTKASQPPPAAKPSAQTVEAEAEVLHMFDPGEIKKVQDANNVGPEEMANLVNERFEPETSDISATEDAVQDKDVELSSPRSVTLSLGPESETVDDEAVTGEEEENKESMGVLDIENRIYTIAQLIKLAKDPEFQELHEVLQNPKYGNIKANSCVAVHDIIDCTKLNRRRQGSNYQGGGMSRDIFGTKKSKKKTPKSNKQGRGKHNHHHQQYPPLMRVDPLHKDMNNSWWATHRNKNSPLDKIRKKSLALLNKITLENKDTICEQFTNHIVLEVKSIDECNVIVSTIFEKSCAEPTFSNLYADLCHVVQSNLSGVKPNLERETGTEEVKDDEDMKSLFRRSIINLCQLNFNKRLSLDPVEGTDKEINAHLDSTKKKMMGNIKFIGDLFKHKLIHESIVHHIIAKLLTPRDKDYDSNPISRRKLDDQLEGCSRLLQTVGKQIDVPKAKEWIDQYFDYMVHYQKNAQNRIHFMVLEIGELRKNGWVPRREQETVKLKEEVRKEYERELMEKQRGPKRGKHGVKGNAKRAQDFRGRRNNNIQGSSNTNAWGRRSTPSSATPGKKKGSQDIRGYSKIRPSGSASNPPSSAPRRPSAAAAPAKAAPATTTTSAKVLKAEWNDFSNSKLLDEKKLDAFLKKAGSNLAEQKARWLVFLKHFICNAQSETQQQMMITLRSFLRKDRVKPDAVLQCFKEFAPKLEEMCDNFDVPKAAEYYGYLISELVVTSRISPEDVVQKYCPQKLDKETFHNMYMTGVIRELSKIEDPDGKEFIQQHATTFAKGFRLKPIDFKKPAKRTKIPTSEELPIISVVLGESAV